MRNEKLRDSHFDLYEQTDHYTLLPDPGGNFPPGE